MLFYQIITIMINRLFFSYIILETVIIRKQNLKETFCFLTSLY